MNFIIIVILFYSYILGEISMKLTQVDTNLILELKKETARRSSLIFISCWEKDETQQVTSSLIKIYEEPFMVQIVNNNDFVNINGDKQNILFIADLDCPNTSRSLEMYEKRKYFRSPFKWILLKTQDEINEYDIHEYGENCNILLDADVLFIRKLQEKYDIRYVYKISEDSSWISEYYGEYGSNVGLQKYKNWSDVTALRRKNLKLHTVNVCFVVTDGDSVNHLSDRVNDHIDTITKVNYPTINQLLDFLNASRNYIFTNTWGYRNNETWNGMTGYLVRGEVEIGGSPMFFTSQRVSVVEYISSPTPTRSKFVFRQPKLSYENNLFLLSFQTYLWYGSVALISILFVVLFVITIWEWKAIGLRDPLRVGNPTVLRPNVLDVAILIFAATCQQGSHTELKGSLGRIVLLLLFVSLTFLYTSYSANIVALLQSSSSQIRTLDDLLHSRLTFGVHDTVFNRYYFSSETEPIRKAIYQSKIAPPGLTPRFMTMDEGIKKMRKGLFAFHMETGVGYKFVSKYFQEGEKCGLEEIQYLQVIDPWLAVGKETPFMELFKIGTKRLQEHGLQQRENRLLYQKRPKCPGRQENFVSVSMVDCYPALLILSYGSLLAILFLFLEMLFKKRIALIQNAATLCKKNVQK